MTLGLAYLCHVVYSQHDMLIAREMLLLQHLSGHHVPCMAGDCEPSQTPQGSSCAHMQRFDRSHSLVGVAWSRVSGTILFMMGVIL